MSSSLPNPGDVLAERYRLRALLGLGGMGAVFRARDELVDEDIALKVLMTDDPRALERMRAEVRLSRRVTHPNVARTFDLGRHGDSPFVTMELVEGVGLREVLRRRRSPGIDAMVQLLAQLARGLAAAHAAGVVHRDLKPSNVLVGASRVVLIDFGIAIAVGQPPGQVAGTLSYMAPEQIEAGAVGAAADIYAFGVVAFEALVGLLPFEEPLDEGRDGPETRRDRGSLDLSPLDGLPRDVAWVIRRCLDASPGRRPTAQGVAAELGAWCESVDALVASRCGVQGAGGAEQTRRAIPPPEILHSMLAQHLQPVGRRRGLVRGAEAEDDREARLARGVEAPKP